MPSIAGMFAILWLVTTAGQSLSQFFFFLEVDGGTFETPHLVAWFLFGNLFCYIASYPILVFHASRVLEFKTVKGDIRFPITNPYGVTLAVAVAVFLLAWLGCYGFLTGIAVTVAFSGYQCFRLFWACFTFDRFGFKEGFEASPAYAFLSKLSKRRSILSTVDSSDEEEKVTAERERDLADSYRHLREHGNTAFIFVLEVVLAVIIYLALTDNTGGTSSISEIARIAIILLVWAAPAMFVHFVGQQLERRFSLWTNRVS